MTVYKTPGVYVQEVATLPASVAPVATAIPAFIGFTEIAERNGESLTNIPIRISSLIEYEKHFGGPQSETGIQVNVAYGTDRNVQSVVLDQAVSTFSQFVMYYQMQMYFANGGGPCYIVSAGDYTIPPANAHTALEAGLEATGLEDEPTIIVFPDAKALDSEANFYNLYAAALAQCNTLQDRFTIVDVYNETDNLRNELSSDYLRYGAAYYPDLQTSLSYAYQDGDITVEGLPGGYSVANKIRVLYYGSSGDTPEVVINATNITTTGPAFTHESASAVLTINISDTDPVTVAELLAAWEAHNDKGRFDIVSEGTAQDLVSGDAVPSTALGFATDTLDNLATANTQLYNQFKAEIARHSPVLAPSAAIAGVYARTDRDRGVWKAPANLALTGVIAPTVKITDAIQENLNVDVVSGKSINAIRSFTGKGTMVWGARTLAGNDNEWRYVSTRRLFIMVEESIQKSTSWVVFEPNTAQTWVRVKAQIENFLNGLWRDGALAGATAAEAFFVNIGMGVTMDAQDILEGRMNIEIGMAAVRPAEFVLLRFSHKLQES